MDNFFKGRECDPVNVQESFDPGSSSFTDFMGGKFEKFDPADVASGINQVKSGVFPDMTEDGPNAIGYNNKAPAYEPHGTGKFFEPDIK